MFVYDLFTLRSSVCGGSGGFGRGKGLAEGGIPSKYFADHASAWAELKSPTITSVATEVGYGARFKISTPDAASISSIVLVRPGAVTHAFDMEQRLIGLINRMRLFAPPNVVKSAEAVLRAIVEISLKPGVEIRRLANQALSDSLDPHELVSFSLICRADLDSVLRTAA